MSVTVTFISEAHVGTNLGIIARKTNLNKSKSRENTLNLYMVMISFQFSNQSMSTSLANGYFAVIHLHIATTLCTCSLFSFAWSNIAIIDGKHLLIFLVFISTNKCFLYSVSIGQWAHSPSTAFTEEFIKMHVNRGKSRYKCYNKRKRRESADLGTYDIEWQVLCCKIVTHKHRRKQLKWTKVIVNTVKRYRNNDVERNCIKVNINYSTRRACGRMASKYIYVFVLVNKIQ